MKTVNHDVIISPSGCNRLFFLFEGINQIYHQQKKNKINKLFSKIIALRSNRQVLVAPCLTEQRTFELESQGCNTHLRRLTYTERSDILVHGFVGTVLLFGIQWWLSMSAHGRSKPFTSWPWTSRAQKKKNSGSSRPLQGHPPTDGEILIRHYLSEPAQSPNSATLEPNFLTHRPLGTIADPNDAILLVFLIIATFVSLSSLPVLICISPLRRDFECLVLIGIRVFFP